MYVLLISTEYDIVLNGANYEPGTTQLTYNVTTTLHLRCGQVVSYTTFTQHC